MVLTNNVIDLPVIVNGRSRYCAPGEQHHLIEYESGVSFRIPKFTEEDLATLVEEAPQIDAALASITTHEIITFLGEVGELWDARKLQARMFVRNHGHQFTQFSQVMMERDYETIGHFMAQRWHLYDQIESEFGDQRIFDEWIPVQMTHRRAFPRGLVLHYLVGNLPLAAMYSLCRGMVTKNRSLAKLPTRDPISSLGLVMALQEVDPEHPVTRAMTVAYWPHGDSVGAQAIGIVDAANVWGGASAVESVRGQLGMNVPLAEYGPRWSASVVDLERVDIDEAAMRVVEDSSFYDQEACFNTQRVYVKGDVDAFIDAVAKYQDIFVTNLPFVTTNRDILANRSALLHEALLRGFDVRWTDHSGIVVLPADATDFPHPLCRTLFVHPMNDLDAVADHLDRHTQTLSVFPLSLSEEHGNRWASAGADRFVESGFARMPRAGFTHDATLGMHSIVRLVTKERSWNDPGRYYTRRSNPARHYLVDRYERVRRTLDADPQSAQDLKTTGDRS